jgi:hypothetical protein
MVELYLAEDPSLGTSTPLTSGNCGDYCYSHQFTGVPSGDYHLRVYVRDDSGGDVLDETPITVLGGLGLGTPEPPPRALPDKKKSRS